MHTKKITIIEVIEAAKKQSLGWQKGHYFDIDWYMRGGQPLQACIVGQIAYNLGISAGSLHGQLKDLHLGNITAFNDTAETYKEVVELVEEILSSYSDKELIVDSFDYEST